jgi:hypothetical protein
MTEQQPARRLSDKIRLAFEHANKLGRAEVAKRLRLLYESVMTEEQELHPMRRRHLDELSPPPDKDDDT